jgi:mono/diheme cytochrome c family protein
VHLRKLLRFPAAALTGGIALAGITGSATSGFAQKPPPSKFYRIVDGKVDARTYNGFRRYNAACNHCHGPDGAGATFAPSLVDRLLDVGAFRHVVLDGVAKGTSNMKGFSGDPNVAPFIDDIYAYLQARNDGALGRGRPMKLDQ